MSIPRRTPRHLATAFALALAAACASDTDPGDGADPPPAPGDGGGAPATISLDAYSGPPGTDVRVEGRGYPSGAPVDVGFGPPESEYEVLRTVDAGPDGGVDVTLPVPDRAERGRPYVFVLAGPRNDPRAVSEPFHVTGEEGTVRVEGKITDEGVECLAMRSRDGTLYTLAGGDTGGLAPGDSVAVEGTVAEMSYCQQGTTLSVSRVERR